MLKFFRKKEPRYGGIIAYLNLEDFWRSLSEDDRQFIRNSYATGFSVGGKIEARDLDDPKINITHMSMTQSYFMYSYARWAVDAKRYPLAERMIAESLRLNPTPLDRHFTYSVAIDYTYKTREIDPEAIDKCISYCLASIELYPEFSRAWLREYPKDEKSPGSPGFKRLAIIYESQAQYDEAIAICELALNYGLDDGTKGGYAGRIEKLRKKLA